jgi:hypothetical protein
MHGRKFNRRKFLKYRAILANLYLQKTEAEAPIEEGAGLQDASYSEETQKGTGLIFNEDQLASLREKVDQKIKEHSRSSIEKSRNLGAADDPSEYPGKKSRQDEPQTSKKTIEKQLEEKKESAPLQPEKKEISDKNIIDSTLEKLDEEDEKEKESEKEKTDESDSDLKKRLAEQLKYFQIDLDDLDENEHTDETVTETDDPGQTDQEPEEEDQGDIEDLSDVEKQLNSLEQAADEIRDTEKEQPEPEAEAFQDEDKQEPETHVHPDIMSEFQKKMENSIKLENSILRKIRSEEKNLNNMRENFEGLLKKISQINSKESYERKKMNELNKKIAQLSTEKSLEKEELSDVSHRLDELFKKEEENEKLERDIYDRFGNSQKDMERMELELQYLEEMQEKLAKNPEFSEEKLNNLKERIMQSQNKLNKLKN